MNDNYSAASGQGIYAGRFAPTPLTDFIEAMPSNSWAQYTGTNINEMSPREFDSALMGVMESEANKPFNNWCNKFTWDAANRKISGVGTAEGYVSTEEGKNYTKEVVFDLKTNSFSVLWNPTNKPEGHCYDSNLSVPLNGYLYRRPYSNSRLISKRSTQNQVWSDTTFSVSGLAPSPTELFSLDALPNVGDEGSLFLLERTGRLVRYDIATNARSVVGTYSGVGRYPICIRVKDYILFGCGEAATNLYKIDGSLNVVPVSNAIPAEIQVNSNGKLIPSPLGDDAAYSFTNADAKVRRFDVNSGVWSDVSTMPSDISTSVHVAITSLQGLGAFALWRGRGRSAGVTQSTFWIYKV